MRKNWYFVAGLLLAGCTPTVREAGLDFNVPGKLTITCVRNSLGSEIQPDTVTRYSLNKDSVRYSTERILNCCGWMDSLRLVAVGDTIKVVDISKDNIVTACDCSCLFSIWMDLDRKFYDTTRKVIMFWNGEILNKAKLSGGL